MALRCSGLDVLLFRVRRHLPALAIPGEMEPALAEQVRGQLGRPDLTIFVLCDDEVGYLMREQDAADPLFAYERSMSPCRTKGARIR